MNLLNKLSYWVFNMTFTAFVAVAFLSGCDKKELFEAPPHATPKDPTPLPSTLSTLILATELPYQSIRSLIQSQTPSQMNFSGNGHVACGQIPFINPGGFESHEKCTDVPYCDFRGCGMQRQCIPLPDTVRAPSIGTHERCADYDWSAVAGVRLENGKYPTLSLFFSRHDGSYERRANIMLHSLDESQRVIVGS